MLGTVPPRSLRHILGQNVPRDVVSGEHEPADGAAPHLGFVFTLLAKQVASAALEYLHWRPHLVQTHWALQQLSQWRSYTGLI